MSVAIIEGGKPLVGNVKIAGSRVFTARCMHAAVLSGENVTLDNVPHVAALDVDIDVLRSLGATVRWAGNNRLFINTAEINRYEVPREFSKNYKNAPLLVGPLLYRFGKAVLPKPNDEGLPFFGDVILKNWRDLGIKISEKANYYQFECGNLTGAHIGFKDKTQMGTDTLLLSTVFADGETIISNASQEPETDDFITVLKNMGADVDRIEPGKVRVSKAQIFKGGSFAVPFDKTEAVVFITAALITQGNVIVQGINRYYLTSFVGFLNKLGAHFEFDENELRVWRLEDKLNGTKTVIAPSPDLIPAWLPFVLLLTLQADGASYICDTVGTKKIPFVFDMNRMGAGLELVDVHEGDFDSVPKKQADEKPVIKVLGGVRLKGTRFNLADRKTMAPVILACLSADGKSEVREFEKIELLYENFYERLKSLGAKISKWE